MSNLKPISTIVVGLGRIGWDHHIKIAAAHPGFRVVAGVDVVPERRRECEEVYRCRSFETIDEALKANLAELAVIATRSIDHCEHSLKALDAGCHVFVDKPAAMNLPEFDRMADAARRKERVLTVNQSARAGKDTRFIRETIDSGILGKVFWIRRSGFGDFYRRNDWQMEKRYGGGVYANAGVHMTDQILRFADAPLHDVWGDLKHTGASAGDADDFASISIRTADGRLLDFITSYTSTFAMPNWLVCGTCGSMLIETHRSPTAKLKYFDPAKAPARELEGPVPQDRQYRNPDDLPWVEEERPIEPKVPFPDWYDNLYAAIREGATPNVTVESARLTIEVMDRVRASSQWKY
jgi:predicted dehydrogenase